MSIRLSISSYPFGKSPEKAVRSIAGAGFHFAELGDEHGAILLARGPEAWKEFRSYAESLDVQFRQGHLPLHSDITEKDNAKRLGNVAVHRAYCKMYHALGITSAVLHCGGYDAWKKGETAEEVRARRVLSLKDLLSDLPEGMTLCLENLPPESFEDVEANLRDADFPPNLGYCLDTGHLHISRHPDPVDYIRRAGRRLRALHMHDNVGPMGKDAKLDGWAHTDKHLFPGFFSGSIDWERVVQALRETGYSDLWNLEVGDNFGSRAPSEVCRQLILKQCQDRAEMIFAFDSESPAPGDPVNDLSRFREMTSSGISVRYEKYKIILSCEKYTLKVDPVHAGRICSWRSFDRDMLPDDRFFGWGIFGIWQPRNASFQMTQGMAAESVKAAKDGVQVRLSCTLDEDCEALKGSRLEMIYGFTSSSITVCARITAKQKSMPFAARFHCMPLFLGGGVFPAGTVRFDDGTAMVRRQTPTYFRISETDAELEQPMERFTILTAGVPECTFSAPDVKGALHISYPEEQPKGICFWDTESNMTTFEPVFAIRTLQPGESVNYSCKVVIQ